MPVQAGLELTRLQDAAKADELERWVARVVESHDVLPMDAAA